MPWTGLRVFPKVKQAVAHLAACDPVLGKLIERVGPCTLKTRPDHFVMLVRCIISQQISTKAAESIRLRLEALLGDSGVSPLAVLATTDEQLQSCGLSGAKRRYLRALAQAACDESLPFATMRKAKDDEIAGQLQALPGIGPWTVDMFLMFSLGRPDVLPVGDLGLRLAVRDEWGLADLPTPVHIRELAVPWQPYRTVATWYLWRSRDL